MIKSHRDLLVWQRAMDLTVEIYSATQHFPREELYGLTSQVRRASSSIAANIAEGQGRRQAKEFSMFLSHARGSLLELDTHLELAARIGYLSKPDNERLRGGLDDVGRLLNGLMRSINVTNI
jgi:four helix bundle protein